MVLSHAKNNYHEVVEVALDEAGWPAICTNTFSGPFEARWTLYPPTRTRMDLENPLPIISKFTMDALVTFKIIPDDDYKIIRRVVYEIGNVDKENPRATLELVPYDT